MIGKLRLKYKSLEASRESIKLGVEDVPHSAWHFLALGLSRLLYKELINCIFTLI